MSPGATPPSQLPKARKLRIAAAYYTTYVLLGLMLTCIGPSLDALQAQSGSSTEAIALLFTASAYVLHQQLRLLGLQGTPLATAQPRTLMLSLFKIAARVKQYKDRVLLHLPSACPVKDLLVLVCQRLYHSARMRPMLASP